MKPNLYQRLVPLARRGRPAQDDAAPFGFATRVLALRQVGQARDPWLTWERLTSRAALLAVAACLVSIPLTHVPPPDGLARLAGLEEMDVPN